MTTTGSTSVAIAADGTEIPFEWVYPGAEAFSWVRDTEHWTMPMPPLEVWLHRHMNGGIDRAWAELNMEPPAMFYRFQYAGPFLYARETMDPPDAMIRKAMRYREVTAEQGGALKFWENFCQPRIERVCSELAASGDRMPLDELAEAIGYGFHQTFTSLVSLFEPGMRLQEMLSQSGIEGADLLGAELTLGADNATLAIDAEVWQLVDLARRTPGVRAILERGSGADALAALRRDPAAASFAAAFDALIGRHPSRSLGWEIVLPTWRERPEAALALIAAQVASPAPPPDEVAAKSEARRKEATGRVLAQLPTDKHAEFRELLGALDGYVRIREGRAYWQMVLIGEARGVALRHGARLVASGALDRAEDVLLFEPDEIEADPPRHLRPLVPERQKEWDAWRAIVPPPNIGAPPPEQATAPASSAPEELRGAAASRGEVTGTARIIHSPEEGARLQPGDILVCVMSTPAWTPLYAIAGGIVTGTGGALSHPAITAREYGIPAVVNVKDATQRIRDGQTITVKGTEGIVVLHMD